MKSTEGKTRQAWRTLAKKTENFFMKVYPSNDGFMFVWYDNFVDCGNSDVHNSQLNIKSKGKNDTQSRMA